METFVLAAGLAAAIPLLALLAMSFRSARLAIWPTPPPGTLRSNVFWVLFRTANCASIALAAVGGGGFLDLPMAVTAAGLVVAIASCMFFLVSMGRLGSGNSYCRQDGLVTDGIYRLTRNPQYVALILLHAGLAVAADSGGAYVLSALVIAVYLLMARLEEPWLRRAYGTAFDEYAARVPRFLDHRSAIAVAGPALDKARGLIAEFEAARR